MALGGEQKTVMVKQGQVEQNHSVYQTLAPRGDLTIFDTEQFHADLLGLPQQEGSLELNLTEVDRIDASCVQLTVATTRSGRLRISGYSRRIQNRFEQIRW